MRTHADARPPREPAQAAGSGSAAPAAAAQAAGRAAPDTSADAAGSGAGGPGAARPRRVISAAAEEWGRVQAAKAPRWSAAKRRRVAALLGVVLPEDTGLTG